MRDTIKRSSVCLWIGLLAMPGAAPAAEPRPEALRGFEQYVQRTEERIRTEVSGGTFLWVNALPAAQREKAMNQLRRGEAAILWRLNSYWRFQQAAEGVYVQCEAVSLTRNIPTGLGWLVGPFVESVPRESLEFTLRSTQAAISGPPEK